MNTKELQEKVLGAFLSKGFTVRNVVNDNEEFTDEEKEYCSNMMIFKIEDMSEKEKAILNILEILGEISVDASFDDSEEIKKRIEKLQEALIYVQS